MKEVISVETMRKSDLNTINNGTLGIVLMQRAALGVFKSCKWYGKIGIFCGSGNNAGDGYALALILQNNGYDVDVILTTSKFSNDGKYYYDLCKKANINIIEFNQKLDNYDIVVDCLLGTGFKGDLKEEVKEVIDYINKQKVIISVDINSGLNGDSGLAVNAVLSDLTVSIGYLKPGLLLNQAKDFIKELVNVEIGIKSIEKPDYLLEEMDVKQFLKPRLNFSNKGNYGYVGIMGGSKNYPGAPRLAVLGQNALYSGCGVSRLIIPDCIYDLIFSNVLETTIYSMPSRDGLMLYDEEKIMAALKGLKALAIGIGWDSSQSYVQILDFILNNYSYPIVIDADGINTLSKMDLEILNKTSSKVILTPHLKEFSRLTGYSVSDIMNNLVTYAKEFVNKYNVILLLKGPTTIVANKEKLIFVDQGCAGMATAGSGDVLTGILVGLLGQYQENLLMTTAVSAYINGYSGKMAMDKYGQAGMVAGDTARMVSFALKNLIGK